MNRGEWPFKILVNFATRGRRDRFIKGIENIYSTCSQSDAIYVLVTADTDDPEMNQDDIMDFISSRKNIHINYGESQNKIHATNRGLSELPEKFMDWDIVANFSDDMVWTLPGWDDVIRIDFNSISPDFSHYMAYLDPDTHGALSTLYIAGRKFVDHFGFIYDPIFVSLFADNLVEDVAKIMGKFHYTGHSIYRHKNPAYNYADMPRDSMFEEQQRIGWDVDMKTYYTLKEQGFDKYLEKFGKI